MNVLRSLLSKSLVILFLGAMAACSSQQEGEEVSVRHMATQEIVGKWEADKTCAELGKVAKLLKEAPVQTEAKTLYLRTKTSTYICVESPPK